MTRLYCQAGEHYWERESQRGRPPISCPEHREHVERERPNKTAANKQLAALLASPKAASCRSVLRRIVAPLNPTQE